MGGGATLRAREAAGDFRAQHPQGGGGNALPSAPAGPYGRCSPVGLGVATASGRPVVGWARGIASGGRQCAAWVPVGLGVQCGRRAVPSPHLAWGVEPALSAALGRGPGLSALNITPFAIRWGSSQGEGGESGVSGSGFVCRGERRQGPPRNKGGLLRAAMRVVAEGHPERPGEAGARPAAHGGQRCPSGGGDLTRGGSSCRYETQRDLPAAFCKLLVCDLCCPSVQWSAHV